MEDYELSGILKNVQIRTTVTLDGTYKDPKVIVLGTASAERLVNLLTQIDEGQSIISVIISQLNEQEVF